MVPILQVRNCGTEVLNGSARMHGADFPQDRKSQRLQMGTQEYCSGALNPKAVLGEMGALGGRRQLKCRFLEGTQAGARRPLVGLRRTVAPWLCPAPPWP